MNSFIRFILLFFSFVFMMIGIFFQNDSFMLTGIFCIFSHNIIYGLKKIWERIIFTCFNVTFFIFLLGRLYVSNFTRYIDEYKIGYRLGMDFVDNKIVDKTLIILYVSLLFLYLGFRLLEIMPKQTMSAKYRNNTTYIRTVRYVSKVMFYMTYIFSLLILFEKIGYTSQSSYYDLYTTYQTSYPSFFIKISEMNSMLFFIYLATLPEKKEINTPLIMYILLGVLSLIVGQRNMFVLNILIILVYYSFRNVVDNNNDWIQIKYLIYGLFLLPILIVILNLSSYIRIGESVESISLFSTIWDFLYKQGVSVNLIGYSEVLDFPENKIYSFGRLIDYMSNNALGQLFTSKPKFNYQTIESVYQSHYFADYVSYTLSPNRYLAGWGYGSSYIAEWNKDAGLIGVVLGNFMMGLILNIVSRNLYKNYILTALSLYMIRLLLYAPRDSFSSFFVTTFSLVNILTICIVIFIAKMLYTNERKEI